MADIQTRFTLKDKRKVLEFHAPCPTCGTFTQLHPLNNAAWFATHCGAIFHVAAAEVEAARPSSRWFGTGRK